MPNLLSLLPDLPAASAPLVGSAAVLPAGGGAGTLDFAGLLDAAGLSSSPGRVPGEGAPATAAAAPAYAAPPLEAAAPGAFALAPAAAPAPVAAPGADSAAATLLAGGRELPGTGAQLPLPANASRKAPTAWLPGAEPHRTVPVTDALVEVAANVPVAAGSANDQAGADGDACGLPCADYRELPEAAAAPDATFAVAPPAANASAIEPPITTTTTTMAAGAAAVPATNPDAALPVLPPMPPPMPPPATAPARPMAVTRPVRRAPVAQTSPAAIPTAAPPAIDHPAASPAGTAPKPHSEARELLALPAEQKGPAASAVAAAGVLQADSQDASAAQPSASSLLAAQAAAPAQSLALPADAAMPAPAPARLAPAPTAIATAPVPAPAPTERGADQRIAAGGIESTIAQVGSLREALREARPAMTVQHAEFGAVSIRLEQAAPDQWRAVLAARDPGFVPAIHAALETRAVAAAADASASFAQQHGASQNGAGDQRYGASPNGGQGSSQPYLGHSGSRDGETAPDHRRPSTAATLAGRSSEADDGPASSAASRTQGGLFA